MSLFPYAGYTLTQPAGAWLLFPPTRIYVCILFFMEIFNHLTISLEGAIHVTATQA